MKPLATALLLIVLQAVVSGQQLPESPSDANADREIRQQSERYFDAMERHDVKALDDLLAANCMVYYPRGASDAKATLLKALGKPLPAGKPANGGTP